MRKKTKVLIIDDDRTMTETLELRLQDWNYDTRNAHNGEQGQVLADSYNPDIVITDVVMPEVSGLELLRKLKAGNAARPVILITAQASVDMAVDAIKHGAQDFLTKPIDYQKLSAMLDATKDDIELREKSQRMSHRLERSGGDFGGLVGNSSKMREVFTLIEQVGSGDTSVIITGESGTGKELVARNVHRLSRRKDKPFVAINAAAIPETLIESELFGHEKGAFTGAVTSRSGCLEQADGGALFLDEIAEMPIAMQPKLLRVLEDRRVRRLGGKHEHAFDVRIISATNVDPQTAVREGKLREDLYYRLNVFTINVPALRSRREDIPLIAQSFIREFNKKHGTEVDAIREEPLKMLSEYPWPGNVRELRNVIERGVILARGSWIETPHLPAYVQSRDSVSSERITLPLGVSLADAERELILQTLKQTGDNKTEAARQLRIDVKTIRNRLRNYNGS